MECKRVGAGYGTDEESIVWSNVMECWDGWHRWYKEVKENG